MAPFESPYLFPDRTRVAVPRAPFNLDQPTHRCLTSRQTPAQVLLAIEREVLGQADISKGGEVVAPVTEQSVLAMLDGACDNMKVG